MAHHLIHYKCMAIDRAIDTYNQNMMLRSRTPYGVCSLLVGKGLLWHLCSKLFIRFITPVVEHQLVHCNMNVLTDSRYSTYANVRGLYLLMFTRSFQVLFIAQY